MTEDELRAIEGHVAEAKRKADITGWQSTEVLHLIGEDVPALLTEVRRWQPVATAAGRLRDVRRVLSEPHSDEGRAFYVDLAADLEVLLFDAVDALDGEDDAPKEAT